MTRDTDSDPTFTRRTVLKTSAATAGAVGLSTAASGSAAALGGLASGTTTTASTQKRGGRAQVDGDINRNEPFQLNHVTTGVSRQASCMSGESAEQLYVEYEVEYCESENDEATLYVIPDEAELASDEVYEFRAVRPCRANDLQMVAFGPSNQEC